MHANDIDSRWCQYINNLYQVLEVKPSEINNNH